MQNFLPWEEITSFYTTHSSFLHSLQHSILMNRLAKPLSVQIGTLASWYSISLQTMPVFGKWQIGIAPLCFGLIDVNSQQVVLKQR